MSATVPLKDRLGETLPRGAKERLRRSARALGEATSGLRTLPDYLIVGEARCGTTSLYRYITGHPLAMRSLVKEVQYFSLNHWRGPDWYRGHFPIRARASILERRYGAKAVVGEASPYYLFHPLAAARIAEELPEVKIIVLLRDPVERAYSYYRQQCDLGVETLSFEEAIREEPERLDGEVERMLADPRYQGFRHQHFSYVSRGFYEEGLRRYLGLFPADRVLVLTSEELFYEPQPTLAHVLEFLELPPWRPATFPRHNAGRPSAISSETKARLRAVYEDPNRRLAELIGRDPGWDEPA